MFDFINNSEGLVFFVNENGKRLPFETWDDTDYCIYSMPLGTLVDNGFAHIEQDACVVPYESIYHLDEEEREILGVPKPYPKAMRLRGDGTLNESDFSYKLQFLSHVPDGEIYQPNISGNIITIGYKQHLLSSEQYELLTLVNDFNAAPVENKTFDFNLNYFNSIKKLAEESNCELDSYLANENVFVPEKIKIELGVDEQGFTVEPTIDSDKSEQFKRSFERSRRVPAVMPLSNQDGERTRVVLNHTQQTELANLKSKGKYQSREEIQNIIEHPTEFFDPDEFDLSELYSDRVIEIGVYKPHFYPFVSPYKSCWIAGATVNTPNNGTAKIQVKNQEELAELTQSIATAETSGKSVVDYKDTQLDLGDAKFLANIAEKQLSQPDKPIDVKKIERKVLIIEENAESLGYKAKQQVIDGGGKYTLYANPFLNRKFALKDHQKEGIAWLQHLLINKASGCLIADDMGLGKTLQILYFIDWHARQHKDHKPYLIVAPVSLLENWENEYERFFNVPRLNVTRLTSRDVPRHFNKQVIDQMQSADIILTNYESLRTSQLNFCAVEFDVVVLDEAQKIKSPGTMVTNAAKALKANFKVAMTGTPVENSLLDLWCIMDFCVPGLLGNARSFAKKYQSPLKNQDTDIISLGNEIHEQLGIYFIRRLKSDVAKDLPNKIEEKPRMAMPQIQEMEYQREIDNYNTGVNNNMLVTIMNIREVSEHPYLHTQSLSDYSSQDLVDSSARLILTINSLDAIKARGEKAIVFAERKEIQKMLQRVFRERYGVIASIINGDSPTIVTARSRSNKLSRQATIDKFQNVEGFNIIIMSPIAAGMGLNVTAANNVIHHSRHWNPAKENQATDRAYRIGQTKDVYVYYPMAISSNFKSFDETLDELLSRKSSLATSTIFPTERIEVQREELGQMLFGQHKEPSK